MPKPPYVLLLIATLCLAIGCESPSTPEPTGAADVSQTPGDSVTGDAADVDSLLNEFVRGLRAEDKAVVEQTGGRIRRLQGAAVDALMQHYAQLNRQNPAETTEETEDRQLAFSVLLSDYETVPTRWAPDTEAAIVSKLKELLTDEAVWLQVAAANELALSGFSLPDDVGMAAIAAIRRSLDADEVGEQSYALIYLETAARRWPTAGAATLPRLQELLQSERHQYGALACLGSLGQHAKPATTSIQALMDQTTDTVIKQKCQDVLAKIGN